MLIQHIEKGQLFRVTDARFVTDAIYVMLIDSVQDILARGYNMHDKFPVVAVVSTKVDDAYPQEGGYVIFLDPDIEVVPIDADYFENDECIHRT